MTLYFHSQILGIGPNKGPQLDVFLSLLRGKLRFVSATKSALSSTFGKLTGRVLPKEFGAPKQHDEGLRILLMEEIRA